MVENLQIEKTKYQTVFDYTHGKRRFKGSQRIDTEEVHVSCSHYFEGKYHCGTLTSCANEEDAKVFFYNELKSQLGGSWLIMDTIIRKEVERFHEQMKTIECKIPAAVVKKYESIIGPLEDMSQETLDKAAAKLKLICEGWYKK